MGSARRRGLSDFVRALIEEAWQRARRRRLIYAGIVLSLAVIGAVVTASLRGPSASSSTPVVASPSTPVTGVAVSAHEGRHHYHLNAGDVVDLNGFDWSCTFYWLAGVGSYRAFDCHATDSPPGAKRHLPLRVLVFHDGLFVQRGHKNIRGFYR
jgi:hypothetical protein